MKEREKSKEIPRFPSLGRRAPSKRKYQSFQVYVENQMFGRNDDGFHVRNIVFEVLVRISG